MPAEIDELRIKIESDARSASSDIAALASDMERAGRSAKTGASGLSAFSTSLSKINSASSGASAIAQMATALGSLSGKKISPSIARQLGAITEKAAGLKSTQGIERLSSSISALSGARISSSIGNQLTSISEGLSKLSSTSINTEKFNQLSTALTSLASVPKSSINSTVNSLKKLPEAASALESVNMGKFTSDINELGKALSTLPTKTAAVSTSLRQVERSAKSTKSSLSGGIFSSASLDADSFRSKLKYMAYDIRNVTIVAMAMKGATNAIAGFINSANTYIEDMNLFNVSLGEFAGQAESYARKVSSLMGINMQSWLRNQGTLNTMAKGMGIADDTAAALSQQLTQLGYDLASFYNISDTEAFEKVRSGLAGEMEPMRQLGYDLSVARLQQEAYNLGIEQSVSTMTQAEKAMLRYVAMINQVSWAHGDMARTIESPANMLRILQGNLASASTAIGTVFLPALQAILPVAIAVTRAVATLANLLASLTGGTQIAAIEYSGGGSSSGGSSGSGSGGMSLMSATEDNGISLMSEQVEDNGIALLAADDAANDLSGSYGGVGKAAKDASKDVKDLNRQVMAFDELNMFTDTSSGSGGSGGGGGGGGAGGEGAGGGASIPIQNYGDFLGGELIGEDIFNALMDLAERAAKAFLPLYEAVDHVGSYIMAQFEGLDIAGAASNAFVGFLNLLSNVARQAVEIVGPMMVALNVPSTVALSFDLVAQAMLTLSAMVNAVGSGIKGFTDTAILPLVAWVGDKLRGAIYTCIEVLSSWQTWFVQNTAAINGLGRAAGAGALLVLELAMAVADPMFSGAAVVFTSLNSALQFLLSVLINSEAARVAATMLGAALAAWAVTGAISAGLNLISTAFMSLATTIETRSTSASAATTGLSASMSNLRTSASLLGESVSTATTRFMENTTAGQALKSANDAVANAAKSVAAEFQGASAKQALYSERASELSDKVTAARAEMVKQQDAAKKAGETMQSSGKFVDYFAQKQQEAKARVAEANYEIANSQRSYNQAKSALSGYAASTNASATAVKAASAAEAAASANIIKNTAAKVASTAASGAWTVATGAMTVAQTALNVVVNAFPGMILATALNLILSILQPLIDTVGSFIMGLLGLDDATGQVTDTTNMANEVLSEEQQRIQDNVDSIKEYEKSHDNLADALAAANISIEDYSERLESIGTTFDEVASAQDEFVDSTINGFDALSTESATSLSEVNANLQSNLEVQRQWSEDLQTLMSQTGRDANDALIQSLLEAGPEKMSSALHEVVTNPASEEAQEFIRLYDEAASQLGPTMASTITSGAGEVEAAGRVVGQSATEGVSGGISDGGDSVKQTASTVDQQTVEQFGSHYGEAFDAGRNLAGGFGDGVRDASADATVPAQELSAAVVSALNGGNGYAQAFDAGKNLIGGFGDGVAAGAGVPSASAEAARVSTVAALNGGAGYSEALDAGRNLIGGYADGISGNTQPSVSNGNSAREKVVNALNGGRGTSAAMTAGSEMMQGFASGLSSKVSEAQNAGRRAAESAAQGMGSNYNGALDAGKNEMGGFIDGLAQAMGNQAWWKGRDAAVSAQDGMGSNYWGAHSAGANLMQGYIDGMNSKSSSVYWTAYNIAASAVAAVNAAQDSGSPSKLTRKSGKWFDEGYEIGIKQFASGPASAARAMVNDALDVTSDAASAGRRVGRSFGSGVASEMSKVEMMARSGFIGSYGHAKTRSFSTNFQHVDSYGTSNDGSVAQEIANAVARGIISVQGSGDGGDGNVTLILRVGNEELARAVNKGNASLARRGAGGVSMEFV